MKSLFAAAILVALSSQVSSRRPFICYWNSWATYLPEPYKGSFDRLPTDLCTHIIYAFAGLDETNWQVKSMDRHLSDTLNAYRNLVALKNRNPSLKITLAIGGWGDGVAKYSQLVSNPDRRRIFVNSVVNTINTYGFDGIDLDWEYPADTSRGGHPSDKQNFVILLQEIRNAIGPNKLLTTAVHSSRQKIYESYDVVGISRYVDYIHVMTYDLRGIWDNLAGNHASLYSSSYDRGALAELNVAQGMKNWLGAGAPREKLIMGFAFYGTSFTLADPNIRHPSSPIRGHGNPGEISKSAGSLMYYEVCKNIRERGWNRVFDHETKTPYAFLGDQWVGYDDPEGIKYKTDVIKKEGYGGAMAWAIVQDDLANVCGQGRYPLATAVVNGLR